MPNETFSIDDLMTLLVAKVGLPEPARTDNPQWTFADVGLDSLAFLQLQAELQGMYGVQLPTEPQSCTFGQIVSHVNEGLAAKQGSAA
ncbi:acyl carrier protein [Allorhizocola rhizosphaerae]|uniref:acyl carrier protein n=1 Tax=Allorhizocola rhizosphaerae TaxID=1872709 RepID=UPI000E3E0358|nr:acyl carrier protein [Allorhizocola rhizosphaerae]